MVKITRPQLRTMPLLIHQSLPLLSCQQLLLVSGSELRMTGANVWWCEEPFESFWIPCRDADDGLIHANMVLEEIHGVSNSTGSKKTVGLCVGPVFSAAPTFLGKHPAPSLFCHCIQSTAGKASQNVQAIPVSAACQGCGGSIGWVHCKSAMRLQWSIALLMRAAITMCTCRLGAVLCGSRSGWHSHVCGCG